MRDKEVRLLAHVLHRIVRREEINALASFFMGHRAAMRESLYRQFYPQLAAHESEADLLRILSRHTPFEVACITARLICLTFNGLRPDTRIINIRPDEDAALKKLQPKTIHGASKFLEAIDREDTGPKVERALRGIKKGSSGEAVLLALKWELSWRKRITRNPALYKSHGYTMAYLLAITPRTASYWKGKTDASFHAVKSLLKTYLSRP